MSDSFYIMYPHIIVYFIQSSHMPLQISIGGVKFPLAKIMLLCKQMANSPNMTRIIPFVVTNNSNPSTHTYCCVIQMSLNGLKAVRRKVLVRYVMVQPSVWKTHNTTCQEFYLAPD